MGLTMKNDSILSDVLALAALPGDAILAAPLALARYSLFDWLVVGRAGSTEPVSRIISDLVLEEGGEPQSSVFGLALKIPSRAAAMANGTISHALDYDDTHFGHVGHLSVGVMPAALAIGEAYNLSGKAVLEAFLIGAEAACRIGMTLGRGHYEAGFHQTATAGAFGATIAAGRLMGLSPIEMKMALGIASTRASGLKSQFGTMGKPFNAGIAASNGVEATKLARRGFISCDDGLSGLQGFIPTHSSNSEGSKAWANPPPGNFVFAENKYKLHACCHGTHAMIEALLRELHERPRSPDDILEVFVTVNPRWLKVCDIKSPRTGLEVKFSYAWLASMVVLGIDTSNDANYQDDLCSTLSINDFASKVSVAADSTISDMQTKLVLKMRDGSLRALFFDLAALVPEQTLADGLVKKAEGLLGTEIAQRIWSAISSIETLSARDIASLMNS
jgi:2-methylcitrate dehydratase PrpD